MTSPGPGEPAGDTSRYLPYGGPPNTGGPVPAQLQPPGWPGAPGYGYPAYGYPAYGYPAYPYPAYGYPPPGDDRPGTIVAAAVLGYVAAGLLFLGAIILFFGASFLTQYDDLSGQSHTRWVVAAAVAGIVNIVAGGLLITGGVGLTGRDRRGRPVYAVGVGLVFAAAVYWIAAWAARSGGAVVAYALMYLVLVTVGISLAWAPRGSRWLGSGASADDQR